MRFGPRSLFCQDPKAVRDALKLEKDLIQKLRAVCEHQLQRLKLEERVLLLMKTELEKADDPTELMAIVEQAKLQKSALEEEDLEMEQSVSIVQQLSSGNFPNSKSKRQRLEEPSSDEDPDNEYQPPSPSPEGSQVQESNAEPSSSQKRKRIDDETEYPVLYQLLNRQVGH